MIAGGGGYKLDNKEVARLHRMVTAILEETKALTRSTSGHFGP